MSRSNRKRWTESDRVRLALLIALVVLPLATDVRFRSRSAYASLAEVIDSQVALELAIWAVGGFVTVALLGRRLVDFRIPKAAGPRYLLSLAALILIGAVLALPTTVATVRGVQTAFVLFVLAAVIPLPSSMIRRFLSTTGTVLLVVILVLLALTLAIPQFDLFQESTYYGIRRLRMVALHPITTANLLGLTLVVNAWILATTESKRSTTEKWLRSTLTVLVGMMLVLTRARGTTVAVAIAVVIVIGTSTVHSPAIRTRITAKFAGLALGVIGLLSAGHLYQFIVRGENVDSLLSLNSRTDLLAIAFTAWGDSFWLGHGHLTGRSALLDHFAWAGESHNLLAEAVLSYGVVGVVMLLLGLTGAVLRGRHLMTRRSSFAGLYLGFVCLLLGQGLIGDGFLGAPGLELTPLGLAVLVGWYGPRIPETASQPSHPPREIPSIEL